MAKGVVHLEISTWRGMSIGATHYYGHLTYQNGSERSSLELKRPLTSREAIELNKEHGNFFKAGNDYGGFSDKESIIDLAMRTYKQHFPKAEVLFLGNSAVADPQLVLDGPEDFKTQTNKWFQECETLGWYEGNDKEVTKISNKYFSFFIRWRDG